jgi:hypothetical protein
VGWRWLGLGFELWGSLMSSEPRRMAEGSEGGSWAMARGKAARTSGGRGR